MATTDYGNTKTNSWSTTPSSSTMSKSVDDFAAKQTNFEGTYSDEMGSIIMFWKEITLYDRNHRATVNYKTDGIVTDCSNKNKVKVKLRDGSEVTAKRASFVLQNNAWVLLLKESNSSGVVSYTVIGVRYRTEDGGYQRNPTVYSV